MSMMLYLPVLALLSLIPGIGMILKFLWSAYSLGRWFDPAMATALAVLSVFPLTSYPVGVGIQVFLGQMYILLECSQPYLSRQRLSRRSVSRYAAHALGNLVSWMVLLLPCLPCPTLSCASSVAVGVMFMAQGGDGGHHQEARQGFRLHPAVQHPADAAIPGPLLLDLGSRSSALCPHGADPCGREEGRWRHGFNGDGAQGGVT